jgi:hypothetical protein
MLRQPVRMSTQSAAAARVLPLVRIIPAPPPPDSCDPVPAMRRELALLRIELEQLRAREDEARKTEQFLFAHLDRVIDSRDRWQREAERLSALVADLPAEAETEALEKPQRSLVWWRNTRWLAERAGK